MHVSPRVNNKTVRTVHEELIDRCRISDQTKPALFCVFTHGLGGSHLFCAYICGHQCRRRTAKTGCASVASNAVDLFLVSVLTIASVVTPFSAVVTAPFELLVPRFLIALFFALPRSGWC